MADGAVSAGLQSREAILANVIGGMRQSFGVVMGWQTVEPPPRFVIGSGDLRKLTIRVREQPVNFLITVQQSLETAKDGQGLCRRGLKASQILLGDLSEDSDQPEHIKTRFVEATIEEIKESAADLKQHTNDIYNRFRTLRTTLLDIHNGLDKVTSEEQRSAFLARLSRHLSKDVRICENVLMKVLDDLEAIEKSLNLITRWWQKVESEATYLKMNGESSLALEKNAITLREIRDNFTILESYFDGYVDQMGVLYDESIVKLDSNNRIRVREGSGLVAPNRTSIEPMRK